MTVPIKQYNRGNRFEKARIIRTHQRLIQERGGETASRWLWGFCDNCDEAKSHHIDGKCPFAPTEYKAVEG